MCYKRTQQIYFTFIRDKISNKNKNYLSIQFEYTYYEPGRQQKSNSKRKKNTILYVKDAKR